MLHHEITCGVDFPALLYDAIDAEGMCDEMLPGAVQPGKRQLNPNPAPDVHSAKRANTTAEPADAPAHQRDTLPKKQSRQNKKKSCMRKKQLIKNGYCASGIIKQKHLASALPIHTNLDAANLPAAKGAYTALNKPVYSDAGQQPDISKLIKDDGFQYIAVDPKQLDIPRPIIDQNGLIIGHIAPPPKDPSYAKDTRDLFNIIVDESSGSFSKDELEHKRGSFPAVNFGFTLPNGFQHPIQLNEKNHEEALNRIRNSDGYKQISGFQNSIFAFWNPGVYTYQKTRVEQVLANDINLKRNTSTTVYPTTACNFRNVCCFKHRDTQNCPFSWCAITALGKFDHTKGGHLILWELKLIIEFPHGYTVLIPSATITHSNTPVVGGDVRVSITQYCAGSILRYADNLFRTDKVLRKENADLFTQNQQDKVERWKVALGLLSTIDGLRGGQVAKPHRMFK